MDADSQLDALHSRYQTSLPNKRASIELAWRALCANSSDPARLQALMRLVHRLAGSAPSYGYHEIGEIAGSADGVIAQFRQVDGSEYRADAYREILELLTPLVGRLLQALERASCMPACLHAMH